MKEIVMTKNGGPSVMQIQERPDLEPVDKEIRIAVKACGINFADILARKGLYPDAPPFPAVIGYEISGIVDKVGPNGDKSLLNKKVIGITKFKGYADQCIVPPERCFEMSDKLSFVQGASLPVAYITAYQLVQHMGGLRKGQTILIQNAGGGVGLAALDIAIHLGAISIGTSSSGKHEFLKKRGLDHCIDYRNDNVHDKVMEITKNLGVDLIIDPIGGQSWNDNLKLLRPGGKLGVFGASSIADAAEKNIVSKVFQLVSFFVRIPKWSPLDLMDMNKGVFGVNLGHLVDDPLPQEWFKDILDGVEQGWVRPVVDSAFAFEDAGQSHEYIESRKNTGKVVLVPTQDMVKEFEITKYHEVKDRVKFFEMPERPSNLNELVDNLQNISNWLIKSEKLKVFQKKASEATMGPKISVSEKTSHLEMEIVIPPPPISPVRSDVNKSPKQKGIIYIDASDADLDCILYKKCYIDASDADLDMLEVYKKWNAAVAEMDLIEVDIRPNLVLAYVPEPLCTRESKGFKNWCSNLIRPKERFSKESNGVPQVTKPVKKSKMAQLWGKLTGKDDKNRTKVSKKTDKKEDVVPQSPVDIIQSPTLLPPRWNFEAKKQQKVDRLYAIFGQCFHRLPSQV